MSATEEIQCLTYNRTQSNQPIYFYFLWRYSPTRAEAASLLRILDHTHTQKHKTQTDTHTHTGYRSSERMISPSQKPLATQHTANIIDEHPCPQWDSNPRLQQSSGCKPTP
jgi:hypothetical protein